MGRINIFKDNLIKCITLLSDCNPGAIRCIGELLRITLKIKLALPFNGAFVLQLLDKNGIYGTDIYILYNDICNKDCFKVLALLSAVEIGYLDPIVLADACSRQDYSGKNLIDTDQVVRAVKTALPDFNKLYTSDNR